MSYSSEKLFNPALQDSKDVRNNHAITPPQPQEQSWSSSIQPLMQKFKRAEEATRTKKSNEFIHEFAKTVRMANFTPLTQNEIDFADTPEEVSGYIWLAKMFTPSDICWNIFSSSLVLLSRSIGISWIRKFCRTILTAWLWRERKCHHLLPLPANVLYSGGVLTSKNAPACFTFKSWIALCNPSSMSSNRSLDCPLPQATL